MISGTPKEGELVLCGGCYEKMIPYEPPFLPDECLCEDCHREIAEMIADGSLFEIP